MKMIDTVYIIDDDPIFVFGAKRLMEISGFSNAIMIFKNGRDALDNLNSLVRSKTKLPELILLDLNMPIMDGWQFLAEFKKFESKNLTTIYIVSSSIDPNDHLRVKNYEVVSNYIVKPICSASIRKIIEATLERRNAFKSCSQYKKLDHSYIDHKTKTPSFSKM